MGRPRKIPIRESHELRDDKTNYLDKELEAEKRSRVYSTAIIEDIIKNLGDPKVDMMPFFHGKPEWKNSDIMFDYTEDEWEILNRCAEDPVYFVENYCTFLTDYGRKTVTLRPYQKDVIHLMCDEYYSEEYDLMLPEHRKVLLLQSRQTGKCITFNTKLQLDSEKSVSYFKTLNSHKYSLYRNIFSHTPYTNTRFDSEELPFMTTNEIEAYELYYAFIKNPSKLDCVLYYLHKHNYKGIFNRLITKLYHSKFNVSDDKFVQHMELPEDRRFKVLSKGSFTNVSDILITKPYNAYTLKLEDGYMLECADWHLVYASDLQAECFMKVCDLTTDNFVMTEDGWKRVISVKRHSYSEFMIDFSVDNVSHSYYTNSILSHNTTTTAAIFAWYLSFHTDKNAMVVANKGDTAKEILSKMTDIFKGLPFFLKPGVRSVSKTAIRFENGCSLRCAATSDTPATGDTLHMLLIDECALIPENKIVPFWTSVYPTLSSSVLSQIIVLSTPRGRHNLYYDLYSGAVNGTNGFVHKRVDYWEVPGHDTEEWKQEQIASFGEAFFNQEFGLSFDSDQSKLIAPRDLKFFNRIKKYYRSVDIFGIPHTVSQKIFWHPDFQPDQLTPDDLLTKRFLLQIDTAEGKQKGEKGQEDQDWNIINIYMIEFMSPARINKNRLGYKKVGVLDCIRFRQIGIYMDQEFDEEKSAEVGQYLAFHLFRNGQQIYDKEVDNTRIMIEVNFNGMNWIKEFSKHDMYYKSIIVSTFHSQKATKKELGFKTVSGNHGKGYYCELGAKMISERRIIISHDHKISGQSSIQQLEAFGKNKNNVYEGSCMHDDIAVTVLFVSIAIEQEEFKMWIEDWMMLLPQLNIDMEYKKKLDKISYLMETYVTDIIEEQYSEDDVLDLWAAASSGFNNSSNGNSSYESIYSMSNSGYGQNGYQNGYNQYGNYQRPGTVMMPRKR